MTDFRLICLITLVVQTATHSLVVRYSRTRPEKTYDVGAVVLVSEVVKAIVASLILLSSGELFRFLKSLCCNPLDSFKMAVPALLYLIQNNLTFYALSNLDAATYQVLYQTKILTTALFSWIMLRKRISIIQWVALFMLFCGVCIVQLSTEGSPSSSRHNNPTTGLICVGLAAISSGFSCIYFEKLLKKSQKSLWARNFELACFSVLFGVAKDAFQSKPVSPASLLTDFDLVVWIVVALQSFGGLLVGYVVKYADNILKVFACAIAFVVSTLATVFIFNVTLGFYFAVGASTVLASVALYTLNSPKVGKD